MRIVLACLTMVDRTDFAVAEIPRRPNSIFVVLLGSCVILTIVCACLISTIVLVRQYQSSEKKKDNFRLIDDNHHSSEIKVINMSRKWETDHRIPKGIKPVKYNLLLHPHLTAGSFNGKVEITVDVTIPTSYIAVHVKNLEIVKTSLINENGSEVKHKDAFHYEKNQFWVVEMDEGSLLEPALYKLKLDFKGLLVGKIVGFYRSTYMDATGNSLR